MQAESDGEKRLAEILKQSFSASQIAVKDISGQYTGFKKSSLYIHQIITSKEGYSSLSFSLSRRMWCHV